MDGKAARLPSQESSTLLLACDANGLSCLDLRMSASGACVKGDDRTSGTRHTASDVTALPGIKRVP